MPIQQSLDLGAPRMDASLPIMSTRTPTRTPRVNKSSGAARKSQKTPWVGEDVTPVAESLLCESSCEAEQQPASLNSATSVRQTPASLLPSSACATGSGAIPPCRAPRRVDVPFAERVALSVEEAGALIGISRDLAYDLVARGELPSVRLGRRLVVPRRALEGTLDRLSEAE
jgi:excisionase family DNA binding protein